MMVPSEKMCEHCYGTMYPAEGQSQMSWSKTKYCDPCRATIRRDASRRQKLLANRGIQGKHIHCRKCYAVFTQQVEDTIYCQKCVIENRSKPPATAWGDFRHPEVRWHSGQIGARPRT